MTPNLRDIEARHLGWRGRLERLHASLAFVLANTSTAATSTPCELRNPLNGSGGTTRGGRMAEAKRKKALRQVGYLLGKRLLPSLTSWPVAVVLTRGAPRALDDDNLAAAFKSIRDGLADAWHVDDADPRVTWLYNDAKTAERVFVEVWCMGERS